MNDAVWRTAQGRDEALGLYRKIIDSWPVPKTEHRVPTRLGETFVLECGPADASPVVLLHGAQANAAAWIAEMPVWAAHFRLFAVDMIGEAGLSAPIRAPLEGDAHALWLDDVFAGLGIVRAALVGMSLGGWLALDHAVRRPERVERLALICPAGIGRQKNFLLKAAPLLLLGPWGQRRMAQMVLGPAPAEPDEAGRRVSQLFGAIRRAIRPRIVSIPRLSDTQLAALDIPVLAVVGGRDVLIDSDETRGRLAAHVPHADVRYRPEGYHYLPGEAQTVLTFLRQSEG